MRTLLVFTLVSALTCGSLLGAAKEKMPDPVLAASRKIDALLQKGYEEQGIQANPPASDEVFVRRIYLDIIGRIPTEQETLAFLESEHPRKRVRLINQLLNSEGYVSNYYNYWADILRAKTRLNGAGASRPAGIAYSEWIKDSLRDNTPYDLFVRQMVSASGNTWDNPEVGYYLRDYGMPLDNLAITTQVFLGTQIVCAQCHNHPFDTWTQMDYYHLSAYTYGMQGTNGSPNDGAAMKMAKRSDMDTMGAGKGDLRRAFSEILKPVRFNNVLERERVLQLPHDYKYEDAKPKDRVDPQVPFGPDATVSGADHPVHAFADWLTSTENPRFTTVIANRLWKKAFGLALIEPLDDMREDTVAMNPELMTFLEKKMKDFNYDMKAFLKMVYNTQAYQRMASPEEVALGETYYFPGPILRRMTAEQIWDSVVAMVVENPEAPNLEVALNKKRQMLEVELIAKSVYDQSPEQFLKNGYEIANLQQKLAADLQATQENLAAARDAKDEKGVKAAIREASRIRGQLADQIETVVYKDGLKGKFAEVAVNSTGEEADAFLGELVDVLNREYGETEQGMDAAAEDRRGFVRSLVDSMLAEDKAALKDWQRQREQEEVEAWSVDTPKEKSSYKTFTKLREKLDRASDIESPAPRGHFLREFGQSDREVVDNANDQAAITQALSLLNGPAISAMTSRYSLLSRQIAQEETREGKIDSLFLTMLSRYPTNEEFDLVKDSLDSDDNLGLAGLTWTLLNTRQFLFIE